MAVVGLAQTLLDLTVEESLTKFGFRYVAAEDWGRLHRLFRRALELKLLGGALATLILLVLAPFADTLFGADGLAGPMVAAAALPLLAAPENVSASALLLRGRYDLRGCAPLRDDGRSASSRSSSARRSASPRRSRDRRSASSSRP